MDPIRLKLVLAAAVLWVVAISTNGEPADAAAIRATFSQYREALLESDGPAAAEVLSARTIAYYDGIVQHTLNTPRAELAKLDFLSKLMVARIRLEFTRDQISRMTGRELLELGVNNGWISKSSVANIDKLVDIKIKSSEASASVPAAEGIPVFGFLKESGRWKLDLTASFALANGAMKQQIAQSGLTEEEFILRLLRTLSAGKVDEKVFSPPL